MCRIYAIFGALAFLLAAPAVAQIEPSAPTGSRLKQEGKTIDESLARQIQYDFAECVYRRRPANAENLLRNSDFLNVDLAGLGKSSKTLERELAMERCIGEASPARFRGIGITATLSSLRSMLTEAAYLAKQDEPLTLSDADEVILTTRKFVAANDTDSAKIMAGFSDCIVHSAPVEADALVRTKPASENEMNAVRAIVPFLGPCLPSGNEIELTPASIRTIVADGLWARIAYPAVKSTGQL